MKRPESSKITLLFCLSILAFQTFAQEKPRALKFDEFADSAENQIYSYYDEPSISQRTERFVKQLKKERGVMAYVIYYHARITNKFAEYRFENRVNSIKFDIYKTQLKSEDVVVFDGGYREKNMIEFWIVPKTAEPPKPTPTFEKSEIFICPSIIISSDTPFNKPETIVFSISKYHLEGIQNYSIKWRVSAGEIIEGQGLDFIRVRLNNSALKQITAFAEVNGLPYPCQNVFSTTVEFRGKLYLVDIFERVANGDLKARLDAFLYTLQNNPTAKGYIITYGNRSEGNRDAESRIRVINNYLRFRNLDMNRITIVRGGFREYLSSELWLSFDDAEKPVPTPTVDKSFIEIPKQVRKQSRRKQ